MLQCNCWIFIILAQKSGWKMEGQNCRDSYICIWKVILEQLITGVIEIRYKSFLTRESKCIPQGGMGVCRVVVGCVQPDGWKITSADPNGDWFTEWRWFFLE